MDRLSFQAYSSWTSITTGDDPARVLAGDGDGAVRSTTKREHADYSGIGSEVFDELLPAEEAPYLAAQHWIVFAPLYSEALTVERADFSIIIDRWMSSPAPWKLQLYALPPAAWITPEEVRNVTPLAEIEVDNKAPVPARYSFSLPTDLFTGKGKDLVLCLLPEPFTRSKFPPYEEWQLVEFQQKSARLELTLRHKLAPAKPSKGFQRLALPKKANLPAEIAAIWKRDLPLKEKRHDVANLKASIFDDRLSRGSFDLLVGSHALHVYQLEPIFGGFQCRVEATEDGESIPLSNPFKFHNAPLLGLSKEKTRLAVAEIPKLILPEAFKVAKKEWGEGTTHTFFALTSDGNINPEDASWANVYNNTASSGGTATGLTAHWIGIRFTGAVYTAWESFEIWDTSAIDDTDTIDSVVLSLFGTSSDFSDTDYDIYAYDFAWEPVLGDPDFRTSTQLQALNKLTEALNTSGWNTSGYNDFTSTAAFLSHIEVAGDTALVLASAELENESTPTGNEFLQHIAADETGTASDPKLVVNTSAAATPLGLALLEENI